MRYGVHTLALPATVDDATVANNHHAVDVHRVGSRLLEEALHGLRHGVRGFSTRQVDDVCRFLHTVLTCRQCHQHESGENSLCAHI